MSGFEERLEALAPHERDGLRVLFVARFAPAAGDAMPEFDATVGIEPRYNFEIYDLIRQLGVACTPTRDLEAVPRLAAAHDYVFTLYNRAPMRNGELLVSMVCEQLAVPYLGAPPNVRAVAEDKHFAKHLAASLGIPTAPWQAVTLTEALVPPAFAGPYIVKPRFGAASDEVETAAIQDDWTGVRSRIEFLRERGKEALVERCIVGSDVTVPLVGAHDPLLLGTVEEVSSLPYGIATYRQKRLIDEGRVRRMLADPALAAAIEADALTLVRHVQPLDYTRLDFRIEAATGRHWFLEFNVGCNLGSHAGIMFAARERGLDQRAVVEHVLATSLRRQGAGRAAGRAAPGAGR